MKFLIGNSFPLNLIRRPVRIVPETLENLRNMLAAGNWKSFWGHSNTLQTVNELTGFDLSPKMERPALSIDKTGFPQLYGESFSVCWILSAELQNGFRPSLKSELEREDIIHWRVLRMEWENSCLK